MTDWVVVPDPEKPLKGRLVGPLLDVPVALGRGGVKLESLKKEGDKATPAGSYPVRRAFYRPDRVARPTCQLDCVSIRPDMGWCDDMDHKDYNRLVTLPFPASHELLWREDTLYDMVLVIGHNDDPPIPGYGSAIFVHCKRGDYEPTLGCVALAPADFSRFLSLVKQADRLVIELPHV